MYTQCPQCLTIYRIGADALAGGRGTFRCGHCESVFDALPTLIEKLPLEVEGELPRHPAPDLPPLLAVPAMHPRVRLPERLDAPAEDTVLSESAAARVEPQLPGDWLAQVPPVLHEAVGRARFDVRDPQRRAADPVATASRRVRPVPSVMAEPAPGTSWGWVWGCVLLLGVLAAQIGWAERERLWSHPRLRPWIEQAAGWFGLSVPPMRDPQSLSLVSRDVSPHASVPGALLIAAALRNDGSVPVAFPRIEVRMTDLAGRAVALRRFTPEAYLGDLESAARGVPPGALVPVVFEVVDPGRDALNYQFEFHPP